MNSLKTFHYVFFILFITFFSTFSKEEKSSLKSDSFYSLFHILEFFTDSNPSSNKMLNFDQHETFVKNFNFLQTKENANETNSMNCTKNATANQTQTNTSVTKILTEEDIQKIIHKENQILKDEILENEEAIGKELNKASQNLEKKLDNTELRIEDKIIKSSDILEKKIDKLAEKVDENIQKTEESSLIIISHQIEDKEKDLTIVQAEINELRELVNNERELTDVCHLSSSCYECTVNPKCGWCLLENKCVGGDNIGPIDDQCTFYNYHYCSSLSCARNTDCFVFYLFMRVFKGII